MSAIVLAALVTLTFARAAVAGTLEIRDDLHVLSAPDIAGLRSIVGDASFNVRVAVTSEFADSRDLSRYVGALLNSGNMIAVGLDTQHHRVQVHFGTDSGIPRAAWGDVEHAGNDSFRRGDWAQGVGAVVRSAASSAGASSKAPGLQPVRHSIVGPVLGLLIAGGLIAILISMARRARSPVGYGSGFDRSYGAPPPWGGPGGQYGPRPGGMGPLGGGILGAGIGGLAGYELGKMAGERERRESGAEFGGGSVEQPRDNDFDAGGGGSSWDDGGGGFDGGGGSDGSGGGSDF